MYRILALLCLSTLLSGVACQSAPVYRHTHERLHSTLYLQRSAEYQAACLQAYRTATERLAAALSDPARSAEPTQTGDLSSLPPAVIIDLDETVLDNSLYYGQLIAQDIDFDLKQWNRWVVSAEAPLIAGAADFIAAARKMGVAVYFITNRDARLEGHTRLNLLRRGITPDAQTDTILTLGERPEWKNDKQSRRAFLAKTHRILLNIGDDLNDFVPVEGLDEQGRKGVVAAMAPYWADRWIVLPNPGYGSWVAEVTGKARTDEEMLERKRAAVRVAPTVTDEQMRQLVAAPLPDFPRQVIIDAIIVPEKKGGTEEKKPTTAEEPPTPSEETTVGKPVEDTAVTPQRP